MTSPKDPSSRVQTEEIKGEIIKVKEEILRALKDHDGAIVSLDKRISLLEQSNQFQESREKDFWAKDWPEMRAEIGTLETGVQEVQKSVYKAAGALAAFTFLVGIALTLIKILAP